MNKDILQNATKTLFVYTTYNAKTDKTNLVLTNNDRSIVKEHIDENCGQKYLQSLLGQIERIVVDGMISAAEHQNFEKITIVFYRFKDRNLGHCLNRICNTLDRVRLLNDGIRDRFIEGSLRKKSGNKPMSYDILYRIITKLVYLSTLCELEIQHSEMKDDITEIAWGLIKI